MGAGLPRTRRPVTLAWVSSRVQFLFQEQMAPDPGYPAECVATCCYRLFLFLSEFCSGGVHHESKAATQVSRFSPSFPPAA